MLVTNRGVVGVVSRAIVEQKYFIDLVPYFRGNSIQRPVKFIDRVVSNHEDPYTLLSHDSFGLIETTIRFSEYSVASLRKHNQKSKILSFTSSLHHEVADCNYYHDDGHDHCPVEFHGLGALLRLEISGSVPA